MIAHEDLLPPPFIPPHLDTMLDMMLVAQYADGGIVHALKTLRQNLAQPQTKLLFTGQVLYVTSASEPGGIHRTDGTECPCRGKSHVRCWCRLLWHKLILYTALVDPAWIYDEHAPERTVELLAA